MRKLLSYIDDIRFRRYLPYQLPCGKSRAYFYHIRKTGGQSILQGVLAACDPEKRDPAQLMREMGDALRHRMAFGGKVFVVGEKKLIPKGEYFFAQSHMAMHEIEVPPNTLTMTCLRDPVERVISHYRALQGLRRHGNDRLALEEKKEGHRLGNSFAEFLERVPQAWLHASAFHFFRVI